MRFNDLTRDEKRMFNEVLLSYGYKRCSATDEVLPTQFFSTRDYADGYQSQSVFGKKVKYRETKAA